jgi:hypothetical protein
MRVTHVTILVSCWLLTGCGRADTSARTAHADSLFVAELQQRLAVDQSARDSMIEQMKRGGSPVEQIRHMLSVDSSNTRWLRERVTRDGWPTTARIGNDGMDAAFLLVQHADHDTAFQAWVLPHIERAFRAGDVKGQDVALLTDRLAVARGQPQEYGTQTDLSNGRIVVKPTRDSAHVDARRASMGLPPMAVYLRVLDSLYLAKPAK